MKQNLSTSSASIHAIGINANDVTLDCNDFLLTGTAGAAATSIGINAAGRSRITVRHCNVQGFRTGIYLKGNGGLVEDNTLNGNWWIGVRVENGATVRRNQIFNTGGSTGYAGAYGIWSLAATQIIDNTIAGVTARVGGKGDAYGILAAVNPGSDIIGNRIRGLAKDGGGKDYGIFVNEPGRVMMQKNNVFGDGSAGSIGFSCIDSTARARENIIAGFATALKACGDAGNNDVSP